MSEDASNVFIVGYVSQLNRTDSGLCRITTKFQSHMSSQFYSEWRATAS